MNFIMIIYIVGEISSEYSSQKDLCVVAFISLDAKVHLDMCSYSQVLGDAPRG
jgi:hypothetical protein